MCLKQALPLLLLIAVGNSTKISLAMLEPSDHGYKEVVVGISPMIKESQAQGIIKAVKDTLTEASKALYKATRNNLYFKDVKILIPKSWSNTSIDQAATTERFEGSDIRVDNPNPAYGSQPFTVQPGGCGEPGLYIHLTPDYLLDNNVDRLWGPRGKVLTRQWAQFRWGVFDELGYPNDKRYPTYYFEDIPGPNGKPRPDLRPTTCTDKRPTGSWIHRVSKHTCEPNGQDVINNKNCIFVPDETQNLTSSLMTSYAYITMVEEFCDPNTSRKHNKLSPTRQNDLCKQQSVWEVMQKHRDFDNIDLDDVKDPAKNVTPTFKVVREEEASFALVLDYSGSMSGGRIERLQTAAQRWLLHEVAEGSSVGIVQFHTTAIVIAPLTTISDQTSRTNLANKITTKLGGDTCIGCGLQLAVSTVLPGKSNKVILLISDGEENVSPYIKDVKNEVVSSGARVVTIAFGINAEAGMERLAQETGGKSYIVFDDDDGSQADDAFNGALTYQPGDTLTNTNAKIHEEEYQRTSSNPNGNFVVDNSLGRNLQFQLYARSAINIAQSPKLTSPNGTVFNNGTFDSIVKLWTVHVDFAENGTWAWEATLPGAGNHSIRVSVTAQAKDPQTLPILTESWMNVGSQNVNITQQLVIIYAEVTQGSMPVVGAKVRAYVTQPSNTDAAIELDLLDNGQGADMQQGDGIYSRYFTNYTTKGRYAVKAQVWDDGSSYINNGFIVSRRLPQPRFLGAPTSSRVGPLALTRLTGNDILNAPDYCCGSVVPFDPNTAKPTGAFTRTAAAGSFQVSDVSQLKEDYFPPTRVTDLFVEYLEDSNALMLNWTATGDDLDTGTVSGYDIRMGTNRTQLQEEYFETNTQLLSLRNSSAFQEVFQEAGKPVSLSVSLHELIEVDTQYFVALRAIDKANQTSPVSNVPWLLVPRASESSTTETTTPTSTTTLTTTPTSTTTLTTTPTPTTTLTTTTTPTSTTPTTTTTSTPTTTTTSTTTPTSTTASSTAATPYSTIASSSVTPYSTIPTSKTTTTSEPSPQTDNWVEPYIKAIIIVGCITGSFITLFLFFYAIVLSIRLCEGSGGAGERAV